MTESRESFEKIPRLFKICNYMLERETYSFSPNTTQQREAVWEAILVNFESTNQGVHFVLITTNI